MNKKMRMLMGLLLCFSAVIFVSCVDGDGGNDSFQSGVRNAVLESPVIDNTCYQPVTMADGTECVQLTWPVVEGAGGYAVKVVGVTASGQEELLNEEYIDGVSVIFPKLDDDDAKYVTTILALGNDKYNNTTAAEATVFEFSKVGPVVNIPAGSDIAQFINDYVAEHEAEMAELYASCESFFEAKYVLEAGATYQLNAPADVQVYPSSIVCDNDANPATVVVGADGYLTTQAGVKMKNLKFDCTEMKAYGLLMMGEHVEWLSTEALGYKALGGNQDCYVIQKPIVYQNCMVKNLANSIIYSNDKNWALVELRIDNCLVQMNNANTISFIDLCGKSSGKGGIKDLKIKNSSIVNIVDNDKSYFIRLANASNAQAQKIWGAGNKNSFDMQNTTIVKVMSNKNFADRYVNSASVCDVAIKGCIFYDTWRIQKLIGNNAQAIQVTDNTIWGITNPVDATDAAKYATEEDPGFAGPILQELDLTKPNGGLDLKPTGALSSTMGDPRWK